MNVKSTSTGVSNKNAGANTNGANGRIQYKATMNRMHEKRKNDRLAGGDMDISCRIIFAKTVEIRDISVEGISLKSDRRFEINRGYQMKFECGREVISVKGVVVWSALNGSIKNPKGEIVPIYTAGLRFKHIEGEKMGHLKEFMDDSVTGEPTSQRNDARSTLSYDEISPGYLPQDALAYLPGGYRMKRLSNSGMLVESPYELIVGSKVQFALSSPGHKPVNLVGRVAYCFMERGVGRLQRYDSRIAFVDVSNADKERMDKLINSHCPAISIIEPMQRVGRLSSEDAGCPPEKREAF